MRTYEEIFDLFIDLIEGKIREVKLSLAEIKMLDKKNLHYNIDKCCYDGYYHTSAEILRELCKKNEIIQMSDFKNNCFIYLKK